MRKTYRQPLVGRRVRELRERAGQSRAALAKAADVSISAVTRLEAGDDVRLSTYLSIIDYLLAEDPEAWMLVDRVVTLPPERRAGITELAAWYGQIEPKEDEHG